MVTLIVSTRSFGPGDIFSLADFTERIIPSFRRAGWGVESKEDFLNQPHYDLKRTLDETINLDRALHQIGDHLALNRIQSIAVVVKVQNPTSDYVDAVLSPFGETRYEIRKRCTRSEVRVKVNFSNPGSTDSPHLPVNPHLFWQICGHVGSEAMRHNCIDQALGLLRDFETGTNPGGLIAARKKLGKLAML